jgi:hypothetical protein
LNLDGNAQILDVEHDLHVDEALAKLSVDGAEEVERKRELEDELVDHDEVADRHRPC